MKMWYNKSIKGQEPTAKEITIMNNKELKEICEKFIKEGATVKIFTSDKSFEGKIVKQGDTFIKLEDNTYVMKYSIEVIQRCN